MKKSYRKTLKPKYKPYHKKKPAILYTKLQSVSLLHFAHIYFSYKMTTF